MRKLLFMGLLSLMYCATYSQYTFSFYGSNNRSLGAELRKQKKTEIYGMGITTFSNRGAKGIDYTGFVNPSTAYERVTAYNGSIYGVYGIQYPYLSVSARIGAGARKHFYNGTFASGQQWYVVQDGGTYLLYGIMLSTSIDNVAFSFVADNVNGLSLGIGLSFLEPKHTHNENSKSDSKRVSSLQNTGKQH